MSPDTKQDEFREEQKSRAADQNLTADNAVPEQRPQASQINEDSRDSELTKRLRDSGDPNIAVEEPHDKAAYDRAASDSQSRKAAEVSETEGLMVGNVAVATKGPHEGRHFAITRIISEGSVDDMIRRIGGDPTQLYNSPKEVEATAIGDERDGERLILNVEEAGLVKQNEAYRGTRAGRRH